MRKTKRKAAGGGRIERIKIPIRKTVRCAAWIEIQERPKESERSRWWATYSYHDEHAGSANSFGGYIHPIDGGGAVSIKCATRDRALAKALGDLLEDLKRKANAPGVGHASLSQNAKRRAGMAVADLGEFIRREALVHVQNSLAKKPAKQPPGTSLVPIRPADLVPTDPQSPIPNPSAPLVAAERKDLARCEKTIRDGIRSFVEVGRALAEIRDRRLYRETHESFDLYVRDHWQVQRAYAYRLIASAEVVEQLSPIGDKLGAVPENETQARALARLDQAEREEVWRQVVKVAPRDARTGRPIITGQAVEKKVREYVTPPEDFGRKAEGGRRNAENKHEAQRPAPPADPTEETRFDIEGPLEISEEAERGLWNGRQRPWAIGLGALRAMMDRIAGRIGDGDTEFAEAFRDLCISSANEVARRHGAMGVLGTLLGRDPGALRSKKAG